MTDNSLTITPALYKKLPYDPLRVLVHIGKEMATATASARLRNAFQAQGATPIAGTPAEMKHLVETEIQLWRGIIENAGIRVE